MQIGPYLELNKTDRRRFAASIGVSLTALYRYVLGQRFPTPIVLDRIALATGGQVTANDFVAQHVPPSSPAPTQEAA